MKREDMVECFEKKLYTIHKYIFKYLRYIDKETHCSIGKQGN